MKKWIKKIFIYIWLFIIFILLVYINKESKILKNYKINEKLVVNFSGIEWKKFLLDLNTWEFETYSWTYNNVDNNYYDYEHIWKTVKSPINDYYLKWWWVYFNNKAVYKWRDWAYSKYWTLDWLYLINNEGYILSSFFWIRDALVTPTIIELNTWKTVQIKLKDKDWNFYTIEKILWYVID